MGAVPGGGVLSGPPEGFEVESYRALADPTAVVHRVPSPLLVLGSTQPADLADGERAAALGIVRRRRRGGGGAVLVLPGSTVWVDLWLPSGGPHHSPDAAETAQRVGGWWMAALEAAGGSGLAVAKVASAGPDSRLVCFAGLGPGEVHHAGRKVVGLTQWRSRQGALVQGAAYLRFPAATLLDLLTLEGSERRRLGGVLEGAAVGTADIGAAAFDGGRLVAALPGSDWDVRTVD